MSTIPKVVSEKKIEEYLRIHAKRLGGIALKFPTVYNRSWPDRIVLLPGGKIGFAELKSSVGRATKGQMHTIQQIRDLGFMAEVLNSKDSVDTFLDALSK